MKRLIKLTIPFALAFVVLACGDKTENQAADHNHEEMAQHESSQKEVGPTDLTGAVKLKDDRLNAVYAQYVHLTAALIEADLDAAKIAANAIEAGTTGLTGGKDLASAAARISAALTVEAQRLAYGNLSQGMMRMVKASGLAEGQVHVQYCPMAFDNEGATWLSSTREIRNPYMGEAMLSCGETRESVQ